MHASRPSQIVRIDRKVDRFLVLAPFSGHVARLSELVGYGILSILLFEFLSGRLLLLWRRPPPSMVVGRSVGGLDFGIEDVTAVVNIVVVTVGVSFVIKGFFKAGYRQSSITTTGNNVTDITDKIFQSQTWFGHFPRAVVWLPLFGGKDTIMSNTEKQHFQTNEEILYFRRLLKGSFI